MKIRHEDYIIAVVGLGYVGLPLAVEFGKKFKVIGFDINKERINNLAKAIDITNETSSKEIRAAKKLRFTSEEKALAEANIFILALPTPVNEFNVPDFNPLISASTTVGKYLKKKDIVIYESTVYPGATREICVPALEKISGLKFNVDFFTGYSPERISPADKNKVIDIIKVTSGSNAKTAKIVDALYKEIITAGTYPVNSMEVAEACKVMENAQRDVNIGFMNEAAILMNKLNIDTKEVLGAMKTKWNALGFVPGLVGGHCIGIDPYYLVHKAQSVGHSMGIIKATRNVNGQMGFYIAEQTILLASKKGIAIPGARALLMGATFKEDCPDIRNAKPLDIKKQLEEYMIKVDVYDPVVNKEEMKREYGVVPIDKLKNNYYDIIIIAVMHSSFRQMKLEEIKTWGKKKNIIYDVKSIFPKNKTDGRL